MPFVPSFELEDAPGELIRFLLSPIMLPVTLGYAVYDHMEGTEHLDRGEALRNTGIWGAMAIGVYGWNQYIYPGMYEFRTAAKGWQLLSASSVAVPAMMVVGATAAAVGYVRTSDVHGGAIPGVTSFGGVGPGYYQDSSDPMGDFEEGVSGFFGLFGF